VVETPQMRQTGSMPAYRVAEAADLLGVSDDTLRRWVEAGRVRSVRGDDGRTRIDGADLAAFARHLADHGHDETVSRASSVSARNRLRGIVTAVKKDTVMAQVELVCGPYRLVSLMSSEAAEELGLQPGVIALASVKSTNVVIELP
jgi:molybdopterin-binding protein